MRARYLVPMLGLSAVLATAGCSNGSSSSSAAGSSSQPASTSAGQTNPDTGLNPAQFNKLPPAPKPSAASVSCTYTPDGKPARPVQPPPATASTSGSPKISMTTNQGPIELTLDPAEAPCTVNSFVSLTKQGYFDNTPCHRLSTTGLMMLQCGDPTGTGSGGPGYGYATEYPFTAYQPGDQNLSLPTTYPRGVVAMANTGAPNSNGSQFFLVFGDSPLPPQYTVFGTISKDGLATIDKIAAAGDDNSMAGVGGGKPNKPVTIEKATVS
ncbi:peptidylprolyl isomerase [Skermania sp. ID1734]|uniref:peptidylprolyl isomerase n=1 Tax=Skermania sp. ID1734 TaxID=2597516 RepID=UPI0011816E79|nr:peptidylprolyl isomerase [Skermania sp. ID1734]TSD94659.1 peptidylprolyl isomerase [Skermania sp. ID1734]